MSREKTTPILLSAIPILKEYSLATGVHINILDCNYSPINELLDDRFSERNMCFHCVRHKKHELCREQHINAIKESQRLGGFYTYTCPLGFTLWISPVYLNERFTGALLGGSFTNGEQQKIKSFAELMLICAQFLSVGSEDCHKTMERRFLQRTELSEKMEELKSQHSPESSLPEYPRDKERKMLDALRHGDTGLTRQLLNEILAFIFYSNRDEFNHIKCRVIELAFLMSRVGLCSVFTIKTMLKTDRQNLLAIEKTKNTEELTDVLYRITDDLEEQIRSFNKMRHALALKKAEEYILENITRKLSLKGIAKASGFSAPYFSKIFKDAMGENLTSYLNRIRVEKAASLLSNTDLSLCNIAQTCGFSDQSWFSKTFKHYSGKSPGKFRSQCGKAGRKSAAI
jgi:AraC-like DNA-binding protein/ligand-binding sensor protein